MKGKMTIVLLTAIVVGCSAPDRDPDAYATGTDASKSELRSDALIGDMASASAEGIDEVASTTATAAQVAQTAAVAQQQQQAASGGSSTATSSAPAATEEEKKKKMSNTTKGILIGAGAGIITGAAVSKDNRAKGAVIGGVIGAATGGAAGAVIDNRKKKK